jgi:hypothetical protein
MCVCVCVCVCVCIYIYIYIHVYISWYDALCSNRSKPKCDLYSTTPPVCGVEKQQVRCICCLLRESLSANVTSTHSRPIFLTLLCHFFAEAPVQQSANSESAPLAPAEVNILFYFRQKRLLWLCCGFEKFSLSVCMYTHAYIEYFKVELTHMTTHTSCRTAQTCV